jgi:hypothetical protein
MALDDGRLIASQRLDFTVHYSSGAALTYLTQQATGRAASPALDRWRSVWTVPEGGMYVLNLETRSGTANLLLDGEPVLTAEVNVVEGLVTAEASILVPAGRHELRIEQRHGGGAWTGARLSISDPNDAAFTPELSPF